jgi:3',5'-cyclic AMP phosphodiesterase CpdA
MVDRILAAKRQSPAADTSGLERIAMLRLLLLIGFAAAVALADDVALVRVGETWRYFPAAAEPSGGSNAWRQIAFDDSKWLLGQAGFSAGIGTEATQLPEMFGVYVSAYFRKAFVVAQPDQIKWLTLRVDYDDGFVAYLNGQEIARRNMPGPTGSFVPFNVPATNSHPVGLVEEIDVSAFAGWLAQGTNVLAIQAHNVSLKDFDLVLVPELRGNFTRGPFLQNASSRSVQIIWKTLTPADTAVEYGTNSAFGLSFSDSTLGTNHVATLANLSPDTTYFYRVRSAANGQTGISPIETFRTLKAIGSLRFVVVGDTGVGSRAQYDIAEVMRKAKPDLVLHAGDVIYPSFTYSYADTRCLSVYGPHMKNVPYFFALGNHDLYSGDGPFLDAFCSPTNDVPLAVHAAERTSPEHYYSFDHGDAHFVILFAPSLNQYQPKVDDPQHKWLAADLAASKKPWKFITLHHPMATSALHRFDDYNANGIADRTDVLNSVLPLAAKHGVQMVIAGHDHVYERFNPINAVYPIVSGGGGVGLYPLAELDATSAQIWIRHHCARVTVEADRLLLEGLSQTGEVFDTMTIYRTLPPSQSFQAAWHTPVIESQPADDNDGNVYGQQFDFAGPPIPTLPGQFSNLGQFYVNNDRTNLYVGIEQVMINSDNNVFVFVESPRQAGVANLTQIGNGKVDPDGEGADGLDFLGNLSFTNFTPSLGCVLGDEWADAQSRSFARPGLAVNVGQGVFRLDARISDVAGARFQQFNRSPQLGGVIGEQNANFIELAIPYAALGNLQPGDTIKLGAVVGGSRFDLSPARQAREMDSSFLGASLSGIGTGPVILGGVSVQLAIDPDPDSDGLASELERQAGTDPNKPDTDGDGLPDGWEVAHLLNPLSMTGDDGAAGDPDQDGFSNLSEYLAGTNPRDAQSALKVQLQPLGNQKYRISWPSVPGRKYQVQAATSPFGTFADLAGTNFPMRAESAFLSYEEDRRNATAGSRFYRVRLVQD